MKFLQLFKPVIIFICVISCAGKGDKKPVSDDAIKDTTVAASVTVSDTFETRKVITRVVCNADPSQSYALYVPEKNHLDILPVIYFFDPHGDGTLPLNKYKTLADQYHFIFIGSNNSKNGNDYHTAESIWNTLFSDSKKRLPIDVNRVYVCGFSGGAKVAGYIALNHPEIKAVIAGGAGLPDATPPGDFRFNFTAIAGKGDLNMTDIVLFSSALDKTKTKHSIIFFDGKHEWAPENTMNTAIAGIQFDAMRKKIIPVNNVFINNHISNAKKKITAYFKAKNYIRAEEECRLFINQLDGLGDDVNWFKEMETSLKNDPGYKKQWEANQNLLTTEQNIKEQYRQKFQQADMNYWVTTIHDLQAKSKSATEEGAMYQRLIAYLSLAFYSISNQLISNHQDKEAQYFVELYKLDDASNTEAWYLSAVLNARSNNPEAVKKDLLQAIAIGFTDKERIEQQPEFKTLPVNLPEIESKIHQ